MRSRPMRAVSQALGVLCLTAGMALLVIAASVSARGWLWQHRNAIRTDDLRPVPGGAGASAPASLLPRRGEALPRLRVPRLGLETTVVEGTDRASLTLGPGHMEGSGLPGQPDNCIIAGHRDGPFGRLRSARQGDVVEISRGGSVARYRVDSVRIFPKDDARALAPT